MRYVVLVACSALILSCASKSVGNGDGCGDNAACLAGEICIADQCRQLCRSDNDCPSGICVDDVCTDGTRTDVPVIESIDADGTSDSASDHVPHHIFNQLTITGRNFDGAGVVLSDGTNDWELELCSSSPTELVVEMPDVDAGAYTLTVASQAGACSATLPVLQGEPGVQGVAGAPGAAGAPGVPCAGCVDTATLAGDAVTSDKIVDGTVAVGDLAGNSVDSSKIADGTIAAADLSEMGCAAGQQLVRAPGGGWECGGGERCYTVSINNRNGNAWKYTRFNMPFECEPPFMDAGYPNTAPTSFGCRLELWVEHHSGNNAGFWRGQRTSYLAIWPNGEGSGNAYLQVWDYGSANVYDIESGNNGENLMGAHWYDMCRFTDGYWNGGSWAQASRHGSGGWQDLGLQATSWTRCTLRFCEGPSDTGVYEIAERTSGPLDDE